jgi:hypothetical protein
MEFLKNFLAEYLLAIMLAVPVVLLPAQEPGKATIMRGKDGVTITMQYGGRSETTYYRFPRYPSVTLFPERNSLRGTYKKEDPKKGTSKTGSYDVREIPGQVGNYLRQLERRNTVINIPVPFSRKK